MSFLTKAADRLIERMVPHATASASTIKVACGCIGGFQLFRICSVTGENQLTCSACTTKGAKC